MSSQNHIEGIPSNKEIIEEITSSVADQHLNEDVAASSTHNEDKSSSQLPINITSKDSISSAFDNSEDEATEEPSILNDFIDEEQLKEISATLTEELKEERRKKALELKAQGNAAHKEGEYLKSVENYTEALRLCPLENTIDRSILYSNRAASKILLKYEKSALDDCSKAIELNPNYVRAYLRRAKLYETSEKLDESLEDYKKVLELDPGNPEALKASMKLPSLINERNEKLKTEMMGKLKDLGNMFLRPFGLSTDNFHLQQDPNTGGYSINFQQTSK